MIQKKSLYSILLRGKTAKGKLRSLSLFYWSNSINSKWFIGQPKGLFAHVVRSWAPPVGRRFEQVSHQHHLFCRIISWSWMWIDSKEKPLFALRISSFFILKTWSKLRFPEIKKPYTLCKAFLLSGWQDSNLRPPAPKAGALTGLRYTPKYCILCFLELIATVAQIADANKEILFQFSK